MRLTCPTCFARNSFEAFVNDEAGRRAIQAAAKFPAPLGDLALRYIALFRPRSRALAWTRAAKLLDELTADICRGRIEWKGRSWPASVDIWRQGLEEILQVAGAGKLQLPLESHGYLRAILAGIADKADAEQEKRTEARRRSGRTDTGSAARGITEITSELKHFQSLLESSVNGPTRDYMELQVATLEDELAGARKGSP
jgi:hypothetical protein